jgi:hypothetical protein
VTAIGTLLAGVVALATFLASRDWFGGNLPPGEQPERVEVSSDRQFGPEELRLGNWGTINLDPGTPVRSESYSSDNDITLWDDATVQGEWVYIWEGSGTPSASDCASYLRTRSRDGRQAVEAGSKICVWTDQNRIALLVVKRLDGEWRVDATVWKQRLAS